jgi:EXLDI family protein
VFWVCRSLTSEFVVHVRRSEEDWSDASGSEDSSSGWRSWVGNWSSNQTWTSTPAEATGTIVDSVQELRDMIAPQLYDVVAEAAEQPAVEDLDI